MKSNPRRPTSEVAFPYKESGMRIDGGFTIWARKTLTSKIWKDKPSEWFKIWFYIISKVDWNADGKNGIGKGFFNFSQERTLIGKDITLDIVKKCLRFVKDSGMISTTRSTRGMWIKVSLYADYQNYENYKSTTVSTTNGTSKALPKHSDNKRKETKEYIITAKNLENLKNKYELNFEEEIEQWKDYHTSKGTKIKDYDASFRTWCKNCVDFGRGSRKKKFEEFIIGRPDEQI